MASLSDAVDTYDSLSPEDQKAFESRVLAQPSNTVSNILWVLTFVVLAVVIIGGGLLAIRATGSDETALYGFVGIALGGFAGLLAPSPVGKAK